MKMRSFFLLPMPLMIANIILKGSIKYGIRTVFGMGRTLRITYVHVMYQARWMARQICVSISKLGII
jgi:hypothetical protein